MVSKLTWCLSKNNASFQLVCRYSVVAAMGAARTAAVLQVLGASGATRLVAAMDPAAASASLVGVGSAGFVADVVA